MPGTPFINGTLLTDLYELTMLQVYFERGMNGLAVFELFVRSLPPQRNFLVAAGLEQAIDYLTGLRLRDEDLAWLHRSGRFTPEFIASLADLRFTGDVAALPEGSVCFPNEPLLQVAAPLREAQLVESRLLNLLHYQTLVASKAARCVQAAAGKPVIDFGLRRAHGAEAALLSARASYLAGFAGTATVSANARFGIPLFGTMAHSFVQAHDDEVDAFEAFARAQASNTLLIDTYDTRAAASKVVELAHRLKADGVEIRGVRIDSGDLDEHARRVRAILDAGGLQQTQIFASGNLDEYRLDALQQRGAPIDAYGIGTHVGTSADAPYLDCVYKLQEYAGRARRKRSEHKATWPGRKQVYRYVDKGGHLLHDVLTIATDQRDGIALLEPVLTAGQRIRPPVSLDQGRAYCRAQIETLPEALRVLSHRTPYPVIIAEALRELTRKVDTPTRCRI
ncbi:nicotinate phosphoribosyltransferase [Paraburkholderia sp. SIMBA_054]|uniref:nicotinate phosphoribosyltransferase n=1 Tax=Paraburkholderia sp. SIMBA_054 TaxID=3085795 RepID=UPI0039789995